MHARKLNKLKPDDENIIWTSPELWTSHRPVPKIALAPVDDYSREVISRFPVGRPIQTAFHQPRNLDMHRKFWALLTVVWQATGLWTTPYDVLKEIKRRMGFFEDVVDRDTGYVYREYRSISFAKMDQTAFNVFFEQALAHLCEIAGGIENNHLRQEVLDELTRQ